MLCGQPWPAEQPSPPGSQGGQPAGGVPRPPQPQQAPQNGGGYPPLARQHSSFAAHQQQQQQQHGAAAAAASAAFARRCQSMANFQLAGSSAISQPRAVQPSWQPASMPEAPPVLGSADDPRWGALAATASAPDHGRGGRGARMAAGSAPVFSPLELRNMMDESSLEIFESQSHLLDPETRLLLQARPGLGVGE